ncbi:protein-L-isoaspartate O-methyltransferase family protein [Actinomadura graeca]|uniref:protein-L-isoaspartate O-methyltransferase family protein n=1 Tax=Actinomadura graeca TaxID=2750812 RepID=UPI001E5B52F2|nr:methyltransferase domain-containing protein [Actinomadura graeca]
MRGVQRVGKLLDRVPRRLFVPDVIWVRDRAGEPLAPLDRAEDPARWQQFVDADDAVTVQVEDGSPGRWAIPYSTSSSTAPWLMEQMLEALALEPGMKVLEIGTGTGWNAAVLADAGAAVTSVEIDPVLAAQARATLDRAGFDGRVQVITGDGSHGAPGQAPFDRVIVTASAHTIPYAWVQQTRDGGRIVVPYSGEHAGGVLLVLDVTDNDSGGGGGQVAAGHAAGEGAWFMPLRGQRLPATQLRQIPDGAADGLKVRITPEGQYFTRP